MQSGMVRSWSALLTKDDCLKTVSRWSSNTWMTILVYRPNDWRTSSDGTVTIEPWKTLVSCAWCRNHKTRGPFLEVPETFRARKVSFSCSVSKNGEVYGRGASCMKETSVHIKNMCIKQLCNGKVRDFAMVFRARKFSGAFEKRAPGSKKAV